MERLSRFDGRWWLSQSPRRSILVRTRSNLSLSRLETFTTVITNEFQESARAEVISKMFFEQFINPKTKYELFVVLLDRKSIYCPEERLRAWCHKQADQIDLAFLETLLQQGANINFKDVNGCTVLHEVARNWHVDIAIFLVEQGADVNQTDVFGRTALHVAAAANNVEMIKFLIQEKANVDQVSDGDMLTPMHCAAKHDALEAVVCLYEHHASIHRKDARKRTPLFLAAANGYSRTAIMLLKFGASATVEDNSGFSCLMEMIIKMPTVAKYALDQLHIVDETGKKQHYYLKYLLPTGDVENKTLSSKTLLEVILISKCYVVLEHSVLKKLIELKWKSYGFMSNSLLIIIDFIFIISWACVLLMNKWTIWHAFSKEWWYILLSIFCIVEMLYVIFAEANEFLTLRNKMRKWKLWRKSHILQDHIYCHPHWPQEELNLKREIAAVDRMKDYYFLNWWSIHDCIILSFLFAIVCTYLFALGLKVNVDIFHRRLIAISLIPLWLKNLKHLRAFSVIGSIVVTVGRIMADVAKFLFLYLEFYFAYIYTYWLVFGGTQDLQTLDESFYFVFRISVNNDWNTEQLEARDPFLTYIIIGTHIGLTSFLCFSIFVALMDNTYMRVYENLNANVLMERVKIILQVEKNWSTSLHREALQSFIQDNCAPLTLRYNRMRNQRHNTIPFGEIEERKLVESVLRIKEMVNNCTNVITGIPKKNEAESMSYFLQQGQQSKSKKLAALQKHLLTVQQELEVLQSQQEIINEELQNDMDRLKEAVQKMCELHQNRGRN